jgi:hypothetical protein
MSFKTACAALLLAAAATSGFAAPLQKHSFETTFEYVDPSDPVDVQKLGFGRGGDGAIVPVENTVLALPGALERANPPTGAAPIGTFPFTFHDSWQFNGLLAGTYQLDTTITTTGDTGLGLVVFQYFSGDTLKSIDFTISPDFHTATGVGSFTVEAGKSVYMQLYGWDDGVSADRGYRGFSAVQSVPEPTTSALWLAGLGGLAWLARRRRVV